MLHIQEFTQNNFTFVSIRCASVMLACDQNLVLPEQRLWLLSHNHTLAYNGRCQSRASIIYEYCERHHRCVTSRQVVYHSFVRRIHVCSKLFSPCCTCRRPFLQSMGNLFISAGFSWMSHFLLCFRYRCTISSHVFAVSARSHILPSSLL